MSVHVVIVTGLSGAGKSTALHALEDLGFFCVDNLPVPVMGATLDVCESGGVARVALGIDVRVRSFFDRIAEAIDALRVPGRREVNLLFLDASDEALLRRFSSTRRPHPLSHSLAPDATRAIAVLDGIHLERERLSSLRARARQIVDTTQLSVHELRSRIIEAFGPGAGSAHRMTTRVLSFGFKYGMPVDADVVLDVRFLPNPFFVTELRPLSGLDAAVRSHVLASPDATAFVDKALELLEFAVPRYEREGKSYLTIGVGCTGGRHRSVTLAELLSERLSKSTGIAVSAVHRDIDREAPPSGSGTGKGGGA